MRQIRTTCMLVGVVFVLRLGTATAGPMQSMQFTLTTNSSLGVSFSTIQGSVTGSSTGAATGSFTAWIDCEEDETFGQVVTLFGLQSMDISVADQSLEIDLGILGKITTTLYDLEFNGSGPLVPATPIASGVSRFDWGGTTLGFDVGMLSTSQIIGTVVLENTFDFAQQPAIAEVPTGTLLNIVETPTADPEKFLVSLSIPVNSAVGDYITDPIAVDLTLLGLIEATGMKMITIGNPLLEGDVDGDGDVDFQDFLGLQVGFGMTSGAERSDGDLDDDGDVDFQDFLVLQVNFGSSSDQLAGATAGELGSDVPEPGALVLLAIGLAALVPVMRRRLRSRR